MRNLLISLPLAARTSVIQQDTINTSIKPNTEPAPTVAQSRLGRYAALTILALLGGALLLGAYYRRRSSSAVYQLFPIDNSLAHRFFGCLALFSFADHEILVENAAVRIMLIVPASWTPDLDSIRYSRSFRYGLFSVMVSTSGGSDTRWPLHFLLTGALWRLLRADNDMRILGRAPASPAAIEDEDAADIADEDAAANEDEDAASGADSDDAVNVDEEAADIADKDDTANVDTDVRNSRLIYPQLTTHH